MESLKSLEERLKEIRMYLDLVCEGRLPLNHDIMNNLQARAPSLVPKPHRLARTHDTPPALIAKRACAPGV